MLLKWLYLARPSPLKRHARTWGHQIMYIQYNVEAALLAWLGTWRFQPQSLPESWLELQIHFEIRSTQYQLLCQFQVSEATVLPWISAIRIWGKSYRPGLRHNSALESLAQALVWADELRHEDIPVVYGQTQSILSLRYLYQYCASREREVHAVLLRRFFDPAGAPVPVPWSFIEVTGALLVLGTVQKFGNGWREM